MQQVTTNSNHSIQIPGSKEIASIRVVQSCGCGYPKLYVRYKGQTQYVPLKIGEAPSSPGLNGRYVDVFSDQTVNGVKSFAGYIRVSSSYIKGGATQIFGNTAGGGLFNVLIGTGAGNALTGQKNIMIGDNACVAARAINNTVAIGVQAGPATNYLGDNNFFLGYKAGYKMTGGSGNVHIGQGSGISGTYSNRLFIGNPGEPTTLESAHIITGYFDTGVLRFPKGYANTDASKFLTTGSDGTLVLSAPKMPTDYVSNNPVNTLPRDSTTTHSIVNANLIAQSATYWNATTNTNVPTSFGGGGGTTILSPDGTAGGQILVGVHGDLWFRGLSGSAWTNWNTAENQGNKINNFNSPNSSTYPTTQAVMNNFVHCYSIGTLDLYAITGVSEMWSGSITNAPSGSRGITKVFTFGGNYNFKQYIRDNAQDSWFYNLKTNGNENAWYQVASREWVNSQNFLNSIPSLQQVTTAGNTTTVGGTNGSVLALTGNGVTITPVTNTSAWARYFQFNNTSAIPLGGFGAYGTAQTLSFLYLNSATNANQYANPDIKIIDNKIGINLPSGVNNLPNSNLDVRGNSIITGPNATIADILNINTGIAGLFFSISNNSAGSGNFIPRITSSTNSATGGMVFNTYNPHSNGGFSSAGYLYAVGDSTGAGSVTGGNHTQWRNGGTAIMTLRYDGTLTLPILSGGGTQMVTADTSGILGVSAMPIMTETDPIFTADKGNFLRLDNGSNTGVVSAGNIDLNAILNTSIVHVGSGSPNTPFTSSSGGDVLTKIYRNDHNYVTQFAQEYSNKPKVYIRNSLSSSGGTVMTWYPWKELLGNGDNISLFNNDSGFITNAAIGNGTINIATSGIATGALSFTTNQSGNGSLIVNVPATNITASLNATTHVLSINSSTGTDATVDLTPLADGQLLSSGGGWQLKNQATGKQAVGTNALDFIIYDSAYTGNIGVTGEASVAFGKGNFVSGDRSASFGSENTSTGSRSFSLGLGSDAVGDGSFAHGQGTTVNGAWAAGFGISHVDGNYAFAAGNGNYAPSYSEISVGIWSTNYTPASATAFNANDRIFNIGNGTSSAARKDALTVYKSGIVKVSALAGSGSRMVTADADGNLSTQAITAGTVTSVGMTVGGAALNVTPATIASAGTFALTWAGTSAQYVNGQGNLVTFPAIPAGTVKSITIGNGLTGTSPITSTGTITLGTPGSITLSSANSVTAGSHTHTLDLGGTSAQYLRGDNTLATFPTIPTVNNGTLALVTSGIATGGATFTANQSENSTFTVNVPGTNLSTSNNNSGFIGSSTGNSTRLYLLKTIDVRSSEMVGTDGTQTFMPTPAGLPSTSMSGLFSYGNTPNGNDWANILTVKGWTGAYGAWQLAGYGGNSGYNKRLYFRDGANTNWGSWKTVAFLDDINAYTAGNGLTLTGTAFSLPVTVSGSGNYVSNVAQNANGITVTKATLPTIGNGTLTIQQNGSTVGTFTANQGNNTTINLTGGGNEVVGNGYGYGRSNNFGSGWDAAGGFAANSIYITTNTPYQVSENDYTVYLFASGASVILPDPTDYPNRMIRLVNATKVEIQAPQQYAIKNYDGNSLVNMGTGSYLIQSIRGAGGLWLWYLVGGNS